MHELLEKVSGFDSIHLTRIDLDGGIQRVQFALNRGSITIPEGISAPWQDTLCRRSLEEGVRVVDVVPGCWGDSAPARELGIGAYASVPVNTQDGQLHGTLCAAGANGCRLGADAMDMMELVASLIAQYIERDRLLSELDVLNTRLSGYAFTDELTSISNRRGISDDLALLLERARKSGRWLLIGFVDLDDFKVINDRHGHGTRDRFLQAMAQRLRSALREGDMLGRYGGDEFVIAGVGPALEDRVADATATMRERISLASMGRFRLDEVTLDYPGASVGVIGLDPNLADVESALSKADQAMYRINDRAAVGATPDPE